MANYAFKLPDIGEGIAEAEIVVWHVNVGDHVEEDAPIADMMTDKATVEISSPVSGRLVEIAGQVGDQVAIGSVLAVLETSSDWGATSSDGATSEKNQADNFAQVIAAASENASSENLVRAASSQRTPEDAEPSIHVASGLGSTSDAGWAPRASRGASASPAVRKRASDLGIDLANVHAVSGDRVRHSDLDAFLSYNATYRPASARREDESVKIVGMRRRIADNMAASKRHIPHFTYVEEIDVTKLEAMREDLNAHRADRPKLTILPFLIVATCKVLADFPMINARFDDEAGIVTRSGSVHLGIATQTERGLMVPVIRDAQDRNIWQLAGDIRRVSEAARSGKASSAELTGSTLTITSLGMLGGVATTPVINRPEVAIIGPNRVIERPVLRGGEIQAAKLMNLSISCDHRVVDGWDAASFVQQLKTSLETPAILFMR